MKARLLAAGLAACMLTMTAWAQTAPPSRIRGTVASLDGQILTVTTREGAPASISLPETLNVVSVKQVPLSGIAPGTFIGTAAQPGPNGTLQALEVLVFPEAMRGTGEGHYDWDLAPGTTMTNANVAAAVESTSGRELTLSYKGGQVTVVVPPDVPIVTPVPAARSDIKAGAKVFVVATKNDDGTMMARFVAVEKDGVAPPM
jgi:hypothetical protein